MVIFSVIVKYSNKCFLRRQNHEFYCGFHWSSPYFNTIFQFWIYLCIIYTVELQLSDHVSDHPPTLPCASIIDWFYSFHNRFVFCLSHASRAYSVKILFTHAKELPPVIQTRRKLLGKWQEHWHSEESGRWTYSLIKDLDKLLRLQ